MSTHRAVLRSLALALAPLAAASCDTVPDVVPQPFAPPPPEEYGLWDDAAAGIEDDELARLAERWWESYLAAHPIAATYLGDPRHHGELPRNSLRAREARAEEIRELRRLVAALPATRLSAEDAITHELLLAVMDEEAARLEAGVDVWTIDPVEGPIQALQTLAGVQPVGTARERDQLVDRWEEIPTYLRTAASNARTGAHQGRVSSRAAVQKVVEQCDAFLRLHPMDNPLVAVATGGGEWVPIPANGSVAAIAHERLGDSRRQRELRLVNLHLQEGDRIVQPTRVLIPARTDPLPPEERGRFLSAVLGVVEREIYPAVASYRDTLRDEILPRARSDERPGLVHVPGGERAYRALVGVETSLPEAERDPRAIHEFGLAEIARIRAEMAELGSRVFGTSDLAEIQRRLREDPAMHFASRDEVLRTASDAVRAARRALPSWFGTLPRVTCDVVPVPPHAERDATIAWYQAPSADGNRPGRYYVNTGEPETRPRYEAAALAFHEALPGHHLQIALAQERRDLPRFRRHQGCTAFVEGWALYAEKLADEMGLYSSDVERLGKLSFDAWRAARLVVDTGLHALGWTREQAIQYLVDNTLLAVNNVENEVDRYIAWPGQALSYKLGEREILALRREAEERLGAAFRPAEFHDRVLENGAVTLPVLRRTVRGWIRSAGGGGPVEAAAPASR